MTVPMSIILMAFFGVWDIGGDRDEKYCYNPLENQQMSVAF